MLVLVESRVWFYYCNMKKFIIILSAVFIIPFVVFAENQSIFGIDDNGFVYAGHDIVYQNLIDLEIPQYIDGKEVTGIREKAFAGCRFLKKLTYSICIDKDPSNSSELREFECIRIEENSFYSIIDGVIFNKEKTKLIKYPYSKGGETYENGLLTKRHLYCHRQGRFHPGRQ